MNKECYLSIFPVDDRIKILVSYGSPSTLRIPLTLSRAARKARRQNDETVYTNHCPARSRRTHKTLCIYQTRPANTKALKNPKGDQS